VRQGEAGAWTCGDNVLGELQLREGDPTFPYPRKTASTRP
jgi:hypothetical protein